VDKQLAAPVVVEEGTPQLRVDESPMFRAPLKQASWGVVIIGGLALYVLLSLFCGECDDA
jgi:hypothetical protein